MFFSYYFSFVVCVLQARPASVDETVVSSRVEALHRKEGHDVRHGYLGKAIGESTNVGHVRRHYLVGLHGQRADSPGVEGVVIGP